MIPGELGELSGSKQANKARKSGTSSAHRQQEDSKMRGDGESENGANSDDDDGLTPEERLKQE